MYCTVSFLIAGTCVVPICIVTCTCVHVVCRVLKASTCCVPPILNGRYEYGTSSYLIAGICIVPICIVRHKLSGIRHFLAGYPKQLPGIRKILSALNSICTLSRESERRSISSCMIFLFLASGFRVGVAGFGFQGQGFRVGVAGFGFQGLGFGVAGSGVRGWGFRVGVPG